MSCFLKDHCNWLLSHCSAKACDIFFPIRQTQRGERRRKTILGVSDHFFRLHRRLSRILSPDAI